MTKVPVNFGEVPALVNQCCKTSFDVADVVWRLLGLERHRAQQREVCLSRLLAERDRQEIEARKVWSALGGWIPSR